MAFKVIGDAKKLTNEEWKSLRKIGGSTVGAIMGFNPYVSTYMVWEQFVNDEFPDIDNKHVRFGHFIEPVIRDWFAEEIKLEYEGAMVSENSDVMESEEYPFLTGNIDGDIFIPDKGFGVLEIKSASAYSGAFVNGEIPDSYYCQIQYYMWLTDRSYGYFAYLKDKEISYQYVDRDDLFIENMIATVLEFWQEYVLKEIPPPFSGLETEEEAIMKRFRVSEPGKVLDFPEAQMTVEILLATKEEIKKLEKEKSALENELKFIMGDAEVLIAGDRQVTWRTSKNGRRVFKI